MSLKSVITLANSIIGVSILAMPFCFKQCGIVLATLLLLCSGLMVKLTCHLLIKSALLCRRRNYELLAFHAFGVAGKLGVEICMIGFMLGTCVAFFVVIGDLAPPIVADAIGIQHRESDNGALRTYILVFLGLFVALPLALLRNVNSLVGISTASIGFYLCVLVFIVSNAWTSIADGKWIELVNLWRPQGLFQCLPIFCMALACQPWKCKIYLNTTEPFIQVFEIYEVLPDPSSWTMNAVVRGAVNLCTAAYICVGIFGYIALPAADIGGNILAELPRSALLQMLKLGFVLSVAISFPLMLFPCRTAIDSLLFRSTGYSGLGTEGTANYIPPSRFNGITVFVLLFTLAIGILVPDIEFVLGIVGSTIGCAICTIFPALIFTRITSKNTTERIAAQIVLVVGITILVLGTFVNLNEASKGGHNSDPYLEDLQEKIVEEVRDNSEHEDRKEAAKEENVKDGDIRREPPGPEPPDPQKDSDKEKNENREQEKNGSEKENEEKDKNKTEIVKKEKKSVTKSFSPSNKSNILDIQALNQDGKDVLEPVEKPLERKLDQVEKKDEVEDENKAEENKTSGSVYSSNHGINLEKKPIVVESQKSKEAEANKVQNEASKLAAGSVGRQPVVNVTLKELIDQSRRMGANKLNVNDAPKKVKNENVIQGKIENET